MPDAEVVFYAPGTTNPLVRYRLTDVLVPSVSFVVRGTRVIETDAFAFRRIETTVFVDRQPISFCWDLAQDHSC